jgi:hypothetical protein
VKEYFGERTQLREGIAIEAPPFLAPTDHKGSLYVVVVGTGNSTYNLKFVELGKTKMRSTMPAEYSCHARSHVISDAPPELDCALASGRTSKQQCSSAFQYDSSYDGDETGCRITAGRSDPWCVLATDENGYCRGGCKDEDEGVTWDYCVNPVQRAECVEFCSKTVGKESGEVCAESWKTLTMPTLVSSCIADSRVNPGESWCAITVQESDKTCASVRIAIYKHVFSARSYLIRCFVVVLYFAWLFLATFQKDSCGLKKGCVAVGKAWDKCSPFNWHPTCIQMNGESETTTEVDKPPCLGELSKLPCILPFLIGNVTFDKCTDAYNGNGRQPGRRWCPLIVDKNSEPVGLPGTHAFSEGALWDYCGPAESCGDNSTQYLTNWNEYLDPSNPGTCAEYEGGMCDEFVPIGSRIFVPGNVDMADLDRRADRFILSTGSYSFLPTSCRYQSLFFL